MNGLSSAIPFHSILDGITQLMLQESSPLATPSFIAKHIPKKSYSLQMSPPFLTPVELTHQGFPQQPRGVYAEVGSVLTLSFL